MKRSFKVCRTAGALASAVFLFLAARSAGSVGAQALTTTCRFETPALTVDRDGYAQLTLPGCDDAAPPGYPRLPFRTVRLALPPGSGVSGVSEQTPSTCVMDGEWLAAFGRQPLSVGAPTAGAETALRDAPDPEAYASSEAYPPARVTLVSVQRLAGYDIAVLRVYPVQYLAAQRRFVFATEVTASVALAPANPQEADRPGLIRPSLRPHDLLQVSQAVDNPDSLATYQPEAALTATAMSASTCDYLLITRTALLPAFQPLVEQKQSAGLAVTAATMESITNLYAGVDDAEKLRAYIRYAYTNWGVRYVLLGGDITVVPYRGVYAYCAGVTHRSMPSDLYFACLDGSWNHDGDTLWGEPTDGETGGDVDLLAEVYVGRAPVETPAEVTNFVARCLAAGQSPEAGFSSCFAGEYLFNGDAQGGNALDTLLPSFTGSFCPVSRLDDRPDLAAIWTAADALATLNRAPLLVAHFGHGSDTVYDTTVMRLVSSDLDALTNPHPFLLYSTACNAGAFDNDQWSGDCIAEGLLQRGTHGAFAVIANSREGWYDPTFEARYSGEFQGRFFVRLLAAHNAPLGEAHELSRQELIGKIEEAGSMPYRWCYFGLNLLGDPQDSILVPLSLRFQADGGTRVLSWNSWSNSTYSVYRTTDLASGPGACLATGVAATPPINAYTDSAPPSARAYYRVQSP